MPLQKKNASKLKREHYTIIYNVEYTIYNMQSTETYNIQAYVRTYASIQYTHTTALANTMHYNTIKTCVIIQDKIVEFTLVCNIKLGIVCQITSISCFILHWTWSFWNNVFISSYVMFLFYQIPVYHCSRVIYIYIPKYCSICICIFTTKIWSNPWDMLKYMQNYTFTWSQRSPESHFFMKHLLLFFAGDASWGIEFVEKF